MDILLLGIFARRAGPIRLVFRWLAGTLNLFAALEVATGAIHTQITRHKRRLEFLDFMDHLMAEMPQGKDIHVILDNSCRHKRNDLWLAAPPNVVFHFTPMSASWLNQVEIWFGIFARKALTGASFRTTEELRQAIEAFVAASGPTATPCVGQKREGKGSHSETLPRTYAIKH